LIRRVESSETISLFLLDASRSDVQRDLESSEAIEQSALFRTLRDLQPSLIVGHFTLDATVSDLQLLNQLAQLATALDSAFLASAAPEFAGCDSFARHPDPDDWKLRLPAHLAEIWETLRKSSVARHLGLTAPRYLVRQPYGKTGDAIETFPFEELPAAPAHESFLWGHSGNLIAGMVIDALQSGDPDLADFTGGEISDLPVHKFTEDGEVVVKCYAEAWLTDRAVDRLLTHGLLPVVPIKNQNAIRANHLRSIAQPPTNLPLG
jgi:type VI secretion system protein ImpC